MFRFNIRNVLWFTVVVALIAVWRADLARKQSASDEELQNSLLKHSSIVTTVEAGLLIRKARNAPQIRADLKALSKVEHEYVEKQQLLRKHYRVFFEKAMALP